MKRTWQILTAAISLGEIIGWAWIVWSLRSALLGLGNAFGGSGDGMGGSSNAGGVIVTFLCAMFWLFLGSPYAFLAAGAFDVIKGRARRAPYAFSLIMLALTTIAPIAILMTEIFFAPVVRWAFLLMILGNMVILGHWMITKTKARKNPTNRTS